MKGNVYFIVSELTAITSAVKNKELKIRII